jgi:hypothetical protein
MWTESEKRRGRILVDKAWEGLSVAYLYVYSLYEYGLASVRNKHVGPDFIDLAPRRSIPARLWTSILPGQARDCSVPIRFPAPLRR